MSNSLHVVCPHCAAINRLPAARLTDNPACGQCRQPLFRGEPCTLDTASFDRHIGRSDLPVVVDFWAPWCAPCRAMAPTFSSVAGELEPRVRLAKVNTEAEPELAARFGIRSIPTLAIFRDGREVARQSGALDSRTLRRWVLTHL